LVNFPENGVRIRSEDDRLVMESLPDSVCYEMYAETETRFFLEEQEETFDFTMDADGKVSALMVASQWRLEKVK
jgi:hypothetical protein